VNIFLSFITSSAATRYRIMYDYYVTIVDFYIYIGCSRLECREESILLLIIIYYYLSIIKKFSSAT
jgi:hypothetical protein